MKALMINILRYILKRSIDLFMIFLVFASIVFVIPYFINNTILIIISTLVIAIIYFFLSKFVDNFHEKWSRPKLTHKQVAVILGLDTAFITTITLGLVFYIWNYLKQYKIVAFFIIALWLWKEASKWNNWRKETQIEKKSQETSPHIEEETVEGEFKEDAE